MKLWMLTVPMSLASYLGELMYSKRKGRALLELLNRPARIDVRLALERDMKDHEPWQVAEHVYRSLPPAQLHVEDPAFDLDYVLLNDELASARLRAAFDVDEAVVAYRAIDASRCSPSVQAMDYQSFFVLPATNPFDPARMPGSVRSVRQDDGALRDEWLAEFPASGPNAEPFPIWFRPDFVPPAPLFRAVGVTETIRLTVATLVTDELAGRVMRSGAKGIAFRDIEGKQGDQPIYRELK